MAKYRKKPVVVEVVQWTGENQREMFDFLTDYKQTDCYMTVSGDNFCIDHSKVEGGLVIRTLEGEHIAKISDYIIRGVNGEFYPCKAEIFEKTYEIAEKDSNNKQTNADRIRAMSDEELAEFLSEVKADGIYYKEGMEYPIISEVWKEWLQSEAEE